MPRKRTFDPEVGLLSKLIEEQEYGTIRDNNLTPDLFSGENRQLFRFIQEHYTAHGDFPSERIVIRSFPHYSFEKKKVDGEAIIGNKETISFWVQELRQKVQRNKMVEALETITELMEDGEVGEAVDFLRQSHMDISQVEDRSDVFHSTDTEAALLRYEERAHQKGLLGIPTGFQCLDEIHKGWRKEQLTTIIAKTSTGKTWIEIVGAAEAVMNGYKVLMGTTEMSGEELLDRFYAVLYAKIHGEINYSDFADGKLTRNQEKGFKKFMDEEVKDYPPLIIFDAGEAGVTNIAAQIDKYRPDILFIDGVYMVQDDRKAKADWEEIKNITEDLKKLARRVKIPIICTNQANALTTSKKNGPELENMSFSQHVGSNSDNVISLFQDEEMRKDKEALVKILKHRNGPLGKFMINFDFTTTNFTSMYQLDADINSQVVNDEDDE